MNRNSHLVLILLAVSSICSSMIVSPQGAFAATGDVNVTLEKGKSYSLRPAGCTLSVSKNSQKKVVVKCGGNRTRASGSASATLAKGKKATINAKKCFLGLTKNSGAKVAVKCFATALTPTPTASATVTLTPTSTPTPTPTLTPNAQALAINNVIVSFNTADPVNSASLLSISGVTTGQTLASIDRRPQNGALYGLGYNPTSGDTQLYTISMRETPQANAVGSVLSFVDGSGDPARIGVDANTKIGMDFNPSVDRIRVVTTNGQNFRIDPNSGAPVDGNLGGGSLAGVNMDGPINTGTTTVGEAAYTNNSINATVTTLYTVDASSDSLYIQNPANAGTQTLVHALAANGQALDIVEVRGFDLASGVNASSSGAAVTSGSASAILELASNSRQQFGSLDLVSGAFSGSSNIGTGQSDLVGLALQSASSASVIGLLSSGSLVRFQVDTPGTLTTFSAVPTPGETLVGIDFRPLTGQLMGLGVDATSDTATLYRIDPQTGSLTAIGAASQITGIDLPDPSVGYAFNFNPGVDRVRVVTGTGLNFRLNPNTGTLAAVDTAISGAATGVNAAAYTNGFAGASHTSLYQLDASTNKLLLQAVPNAGVATDVATLSLDFDSLVGFDIPASVSVSTNGAAVSSGLGYAALNVGGVTSLYTINLVTGAATLKGAIGTGSTALRGLAVGEIEAR